MGRWIIPALAVLAGLAIADIVSSDQIVFTATYVLVPFAMAVSGRTRATAATAVLAFALSLASGVWNHTFGSADHIIRVEIVAVGGCLATLSAAALEKAAEQRRRMSILAAVGRLSGVHTLEEAIEGVAESLVPDAADGVWVELLEPDGTSRRLFEYGVAAPVASQTGPARLLEDGRRALVALTASEDGTGLLGLTTAKGAYDDDDLQFFTILAGRVALVLDNARLVSSLQSTQARLDGILNSLAEAVTVNDDRGRVVYANPAAARLIGVASPEEVIDARDGELAERFLITRETGEPVSRDEFPGVRVVRGEPAPELLTRTIDRVSGQAYWLLTKASLLEDQGRRYAVNIIEDITEAKESEHRQRFLARAGQVLASSLEYEQTLKRVAALSVPWLADWCAVELPDGNGGIELVALAHSDPRKLEAARELRRRFPLDPKDDTGVPGILKGAPAQLVREITPELLGAVTHGPDELEAIQQLGMRSAMIVPMRAADTTLGAITFVTADSGRRFDDDDFAFAQDLALRAATAVQNARLYAAQRRVAYTLQASLLPDALPDVPGYELAASYQAGEQGADVGGDFYDIISTDAGNLVFLGDVTGKGIAAAALTSLVRHSTRTAARFDPRPPAILTLVNDILSEQAQLSPVTLVTLLIDDDRVTIATAGHPPPLLRRADGTVTPVGPTGILLGAISEQTFREQTITLAPGDSLLLYTDGVTDTPGDGERFGDARLASALHDAPADPRAIIAAIERELTDFQADRAIDDRALLVLHRR